VLFNVQSALFAMVVCKVCADRADMCRAVDDMMRLLARGQAARRVGETNMNRESSRSHSVFICTLQSTTTDDRGITNTLRSRLNLVDLAGVPTSDRTNAVSWQGQWQGPPGVWPKSCPGWHIEEVACHIPASPDTQRSRGPEF
jgi:Tfp pilus assembly protein PilX